MNTHTRARTASGLYQAKTHIQAPPPGLLLLLPPSSGSGACPGEDGRNRRLGWHGQWGSRATGFFSSEVSGLAESLCMYWRKHQPYSFETKACTINWPPNKTQLCNSVHMTLTPTPCRRAMPRKLEGCKATQCEGGPLLASS